MGLDALRAPAGAGDSGGGDGAPPGAPPPPPLFVRVPRGRILSDIQLQGAISDFHVIKDAVKAADCDPLLVRANPDDMYGDGGNFEVGTLRRGGPLMRGGLDGKG